MRWWIQNFRREEAVVDTFQLAVEHLLPPWPRETLAFCGYLTFFGIPSTVRAVTRLAVA
jgi:hypothetical protein